MKFSRNVRGGVLIDHIRFYVLAIAVGLIFSAVAATAATTISTNISTGGTLTATGLSTFGNASSTLFSAYGPAYFGATATSSFSSAGVLSLISALTVPNGGTGVSIFGQGWIYSSGGIGALTASTSPTVNYITATSTTVSSIFPYASTTALSSTGSAWFATSGGNVGIGTTSPWGKVSIENGVLTTPAFAVSTSTGKTAFTINTNGDARPYGRFLLPMGEVSYFSMTGTTTTMGGTSDGSTNMIVVSPASTLNSDMEFDNGGANNGRMRYTGETTKVFHIAVTLSGTPANANDVFVFGLAKNGTVVTASKVLGSSSGTQFSALHAMVTLSKNDYVELYVGNTTATRNITIKTLNIFAIGM